MTFLATSPKRFRTDPSRGTQPRVDRRGGDNGAGVIYGVSICTRGEALGHRHWLDDEFIESVYLGIKQTGKKGLKMRFTHPSQSGDGMGSFLGRAKNPTREEGRALAELHFARIAHNTPDGDLAAYVMDLAEEDPEAFGTSIVYDTDYGAENKFIALHQDEGGRFKSPDSDNKQNFRHARLAKLLAADVVDDPAANPEGLFHRGQEIADEADRLCAYALGLSDEKPDVRLLSVDADRLAGFATRFFQSHHLELRSKPMPKENQTAPQKEIDAAVAEASAQLKADHEKQLAQLKSEHEQALAALKGDKTGDGGRCKNPEQPSLDEALSAERTRVKELHALYAQAGLSEQALLDRWVDKKLSVLEAKAEVGELAIKHNKLSREEEGGDDGQDPDKKYRGEYRAQLAAFAKMGLSEAEYITSRKIDDGSELLAPASAQ